MCDGDPIAQDMAWEAHALAQENSKQLDRIEAALRIVLGEPGNPYSMSFEALNILNGKWSIPTKGTPS